MIFFVRLRVLRAFVVPAAKSVCVTAQRVNIDEAAKLAVKEMIEFLVAEKKMNRDEAYILCSVAADLHVTQLVDGTKGVHAMLAKSMFTR